jgi:hypothetical protein
MGAGKKKRLNSKACKWRCRLKSKTRRWSAKDTTQRLENGVVDLNQRLEDSAQKTRFKGLKMASVTQIKG